MNVSLRFDLRGPDRAVCRLGVGDRSFALTASYLADALGDLASAAVDLVHGTRLATLTLHEDPGQFDWILERDETSDALRLRIAWREDWDRVEGRVVFEATCAVRELAAAVAAALKQAGRDGAPVPEKLAAELDAVLA